MMKMILACAALLLITAADAATIPCEGAAGHEDAHTNTLNALSANNCTSVTECPEGSPCAEVVEELFDYYTRCSIDHDAEDAVFQQMETDDGACMVHATHGVHADEAHDDHDDHDHGADHGADHAATIPCEGAAGHEDAHTNTLTKLKANHCHHADDHPTCPEGSPCAEVVEELANYYIRCSIDHDAEDALFQQMETDDGACMVHMPGHDAKAKRSKPWGEAIGAAVIVNIVTLAGIALMVPVVAQVIENFPRHFEVVGNSFAGGTLLATAVFFLLYESTHLIPINDSQEEAMASAKWGCMILLGFLVSSIVDLGAHGVRIVTNKDECSVCEQPNKDVESIKNVEPELSFSARQFHILSSVLVGDWLHNFCDGIFIGTAFVTCGHSMGWSVTAATAFHELAQEISDYIILTEQAKLTPLLALALNFLSGTSVIIGVVVVMAVDAIEGEVTGMLLAFGGGVYMQIGGVECMGKMHLRCTTIELRVLSLAAFAVGCIAIGLVLLDHEHCSAGGHDDHGHK